MKLEIITETLAKHLGARRDGDVFTLPTDAELTLLVGLTGDTLSVSRITRLELDFDGTVLVVDDTRGERHVVAVEDVRVLKVDRHEATGRERGAGFGK